MDRHHPPFEALYAAHAPAVRGYALRRTDAATADDVVSEVFLVAWRRLDDLPAEPRLWLLGAARKVLANQRRSLARRAVLHDQLVHERPGVATGDPEPGGDSAVLAALAALRPADREALLLVGWDGLAPGEAAAVLGMRPNSFTMRLSRARRRFADQLAAADTDADASADPILSPQEVRDAR